ncbi:Hpt domain-containing protein [Sphingomonas prati]|nr:Hpt domain-containing protein [Sphingomonas prati]
MVYDPGAMEAALSAAVGDDPALAGELQAAFFDSAATMIAALAKAAGPAEWEQAAWRLKGLAASFGAIELMIAADAAGRAAPGDEDAVDAVRAAID